MNELEPWSRREAIAEELRQRFLSSKNGTKQNDRTQL